jgi:hypothetical protein
MAMTLSADDSAGRRGSVTAGALAPGGRLPRGLVRHLTSAQAIRLAAGRHRQAFRPGRILLYRDHIPYVSYLVLEGSVGFELGRGTRLARAVRLDAPLLIGEAQVTHRKSFPMTVRVHDQAVVCALARASDGAPRPARKSPAA